ncbi:MAG: hypothetical protein MJ188_07295 [Treponema sp.]|nr:hypothetical protein [Treponema sp.]
MTGKYRIFLILSIFVFTGCQLFGTPKVPYLISGEMTMESSAQYEVAGFDYYFLNKVNKTVKDFTMVFFLFDQEGNSPCIGSNNIVLKIEGDVPEGRSVTGCVSLDSLLTEIPEESYDIDFLYVSRISYEDGSVWSDPFGIYAF